MLSTTTLQVGLHVEDETNSSPQGEGLAWAESRSRAEETCWSRLADRFVVCSLVHRAARWTI